MTDPLYREEVDRKQAMTASPGYWNDRLNVLRRQRDKVEREIAFTLRMLQHARRATGV